MDSRRRGRDIEVYQTLATAVFHLYLGPGSAGFVQECEGFARGSSDAPARSFDPLFLWFWCFCNLCAHIYEFKYLSCRRLVSLDFGCHDRNLGSRLFTTETIKYCITIKLQYRMINETVKNWYTMIQNLIQSIFD